jgi:hypothetical protein
MLEYLFVSPILQGLIPASTWYDYDLLLEDSDKNCLFVIERTKILCWGSEQTVVTFKHSPIGPDFYGFGVNDCKLRVTS